MDDSRIGFRRLSAMKEALLGYLPGDTQDPHLSKAGEDTLVSSLRLMVKSCSAGCGKGCAPLLTSLGSDADTAWGVPRDNFTQAVTWMVGRSSLLGASPLDQLHALLDALDSCPLLNL